MNRAYECRGIDKLRDGSVVAAGGVRVTLLPGYICEKERRVVERERHAAASCMTTRPGDVSPSVRDHHISCMSEPLTRCTLYWRRVTEQVLVVIFDSLEAA